MAKNTGASKEVRQTREAAFKQWLRDNSGKVCPKCGTWWGPPENKRCKACNHKREGSVDVEC